MANSDDTMSRLDRLEAGVSSLNQAMVQVSEILLDMNQGIDRLGVTLGSRLDRLIELQARSLTDWAERHQSHEQRITSLEHRLDRLEK